MLYLTRKEGSAVVLVLPDGRTVTVTCRRRRGRPPGAAPQAVLEVDAPRDVPVWRAELLPLRQGVARA